MVNVIAANTNHVKNSPPGFSDFATKIASVFKTPLGEVINKLEIKLLAQWIPIANSNPSSNNAKAPKKKPNTV